MTAGSKSWARALRLGKARSSRRLFLEWNCIPVLHLDGAAPCGSAASCQANGGRYRS
ncbi:hypothetical protein FHW73_002399 [Luteimonas sp. RC10]|nr:hypothetical protein [Luteimonas sp. RC10]